MSPLQAINPARRLWRKPAADDAYSEWFNAQQLCGQALRTLGRRARVVGARRGLLRLLLRARPRGAGRYQAPTPRRGPRGRVTSGG